MCDDLLFVMAIRFIKESVAYAVKALSHGFRRISHIRSIVKSAGGAITGTSCNTAENTIFKSHFLSNSKRYCWKRRTLP